MNTQLADVQRLADEFSVSKSTIEKMIRSQQLPQPFRAGRKRVWHLPDIVDHMKKRRDSGIDNAPPADDADGASVSQLGRPRTLSDHASAASEK